MNTEKQNADSARLSDRILSALELALDQQDLIMSESLLRVLELSMTRDTGGDDFKEKRSYPKAVEEAIEQFNILKVSSDEN